MQHSQLKRHAIEIATAYADLAESTYEPTAYPTRETVALDLLAVLQQARLDTKLARELGLRARKLSKPTVEVYVQNGYGDEAELKPYDLLAANLADGDDSLGVTVDISANLTRAAKKLLNDKRPDANPWLRFVMADKLVTK